MLATKINAFKDEQLRFIADDSRMGHVASGPVCPPEALPVMLGDPERFIDGLIRLPGKDLAFKATNAVAKADAGDNPLQATPDTLLIPFFRLHDSRYQIYWPKLEKSEFRDFVDDAKASASARALLRAKTVDMLTPGEQQPEVEHNFAGQNTRTGVTNGRRWREAAGWFSYTLSNPDGRARSLRLTYFEGDSDRTFDITVNGRKLSRVSLPEGQPDSEFYQVDYVLPPELSDAQTLTLRFDALPGSVAGAIYGIRLLAQP